MGMKWRRWWAVLKVLLALAIVAGVGRQFARILGDGTWQEALEIRRWELVVAAGLLYLSAHASWGSFWVRLLREQGIAVGWYAGLRCYYVSQFGKYVPGKAWVIVLRVGMLRQQLRAPAAVVAVTATYETFASMSAGALTAVLCLPMLGVLPVELAERWGWFVAVAALPLGLGMAHRVMHRWLQRRVRSGATELKVPSWQLLAQGVVHGLVGWLLLGVSLGLMVQALLGKSAAADTRQFAALLGALALAYVAGFVVLAAPGGLGVREWVLLQTLPPLLPEAQLPAETLAAAVALWLRLVWTAAEVLAAGLLYLRPPTTITISVKHPPDRTPGAYVSAKC